MKLIGYTFTYNEAGMIPYAMPYVERLGYDKFIVYDNYSTDNTVELLSRYPFVEIRYIDTNGVFTDDAKRQKQIDAYLECYAMAKVGTPEEEQVWMTFTDFDEVIYCSCDEGMFKGFLDEVTFVGHENCFFSNLVNLLPPKELLDTPRKLLGDDGKGLVHLNEGMRGQWICGRGVKPLLYLVNDFSYMAFTLANHYIVCTPREGKEIRNLDKTGFLHSFHLKFIDRENLKRRYENYSKRGVDYYGYVLDKIDRQYRDGMYGASFPLETYFCMKGFMATTRDDDSVNYGIRLVK